MAEDQTELAEDRTNLAEDRTILANERTFAGWMRTAYAAVGIGLGFNALFSKMQPEWAPKAIATAFLMIAVIMFIAAERRACAVTNRLHAHKVVTMNITSLRVMTIMSVAATAALIAAIWMLKIAV